MDVQARGRYPGYALKMLEREGIDVGMTAEDERILALLDVIRSEAFRKEVAALGGYGVEKTGQVIWEYDGR